MLIIVEQIADLKKKHKEMESLNNIFKDYKYTSNFEYTINILSTIYGKDGSKYFDNNQHKQDCIQTIINGGDILPAGLDSKGDENAKTIYRAIETYSKPKEGSDSSNQIDKTTKERLSKILMMPRVKEVAGIDEDELQALLAALGEL